jgi:4-diphosphocytidyl-2-C-methyl-D-erythritol kinase
MTTYEAPAKLNLSLLVSPPRVDGYHPLESLVQTVEWCDILEVELSEEGSDSLNPDIDNNLVEKALSRLREVRAVPPLDITLRKEIPTEAGLGGGSSDAAAVLVAGADFGGTSRSELGAVASRIGADVTLFLTGGTVMMTGVGEKVESLRPLAGFAVAIVVPDFGLATKEVYQRWDTLEGPVGEAVADELLPPSLRGGMPIRNDLLPAARDLEPRLGDFMADVASMWGTSVCLTGSGSACFGFFGTVDEAKDAASAVSGMVGEGRGVALRERGVARSSGP